MFAHALDQFIKQLKSGKALNEWYLSNFIETHVNVLSTSDAYNLSSLVLTIMTDSSNSDLLYELICISIALQRQSDSTQIPSILISYPDILNEVGERTTDPHIYELIHTLKQSYRI